MQEMKSFIEEQFPVSKVSKESYKERKSGIKQTLTSLGKWWGRKPLILVRASIVGMLMPVSNDPKKDREVFLKILTMDEDGLWQRKEKSIPANTIYENISKEKQNEYFEFDAKGKTKWQSGVSNEIKQILQKEVFDKFSYDEKLTYCLRPEEIEGPSKEAWDDINNHLGTTAKSIQELVDQLGKKRFGHTPKVGDAFAGGGSIPFEAARIGCNTYASDLNPVSSILTWAGINIIGGNESILNEINKLQNEVFDKCNKEILDWNIEVNEKGWRADSYLYCIEIESPLSGYKIPLSPAWILSEKFKVVAKLIPDHQNKCFDIEIIENADNETYKNAKNGTVKNGRFFDPIANEDIPIASIRTNNNNSGLRLWNKEDFIPQKEDVFQERLYCIRYVEESIVTDKQGNEKIIYTKHFCKPDKNDFKREEKVVSIVKDLFAEWQKNGYIPSLKIEEGYNTNQLVRERGWTYWHHLFNPRQLLTNGLILKNFPLNDKLSSATALLTIKRVTNYNSKLCRWMPNKAVSDGTGFGIETFANQALNTNFNPSTRSLYTLKDYIVRKYKSSPFKNSTVTVLNKDAREIIDCNDLWITDPPYADAVNYHELTDFFTAWYEKDMQYAFNDWSTDTKKILAVKGSGEDFKKSMVDIYTNLSKHMSDNGLQMVQFTHQDPSVWADLAMILWASGLRVTAAWTIATEASTGLKTGNYVQGTVLLILRKRINSESAFISDIYTEIEDEVKRQLDEMHNLDDNEDPNFADTDYQLAAYAAALRVLTWYDIEGYDVKHELFRERKKGEKNQFEQMIDKAVEIATNYLIPDGIDKMVWRDLSSDERFYLKGLELEKHGEMRSGAYQEMAKGFGVREYTSLFASSSANSVRFKTPSEFKKSQLNSSGFGETTIRQLLFAVSEVTRTESVREGINYLRAEITDYWNKRKLLIALLKYFIRFDQIEHMAHWQLDVNSARLLSGAIDNDTPGA